jgi:hypothetical protein
MAWFARQEAFVDSAFVRIGDYGALLALDRSSYPEGTDSPGCVFPQETGELSFVLADGRRWAMRGQAIGSWSGPDETWMWAWANDSIHGAFSVESARVRDLAKQERGLPAMTTGKFSALQPLGTELALHAAALMGAQGACSPAGGVSSAA